MPLDFDELNRKKNRRFGAGWKPDAGDNEVRILPPTSRYFTDLIGFIAYEFRNHFIQLPGQDTRVKRCLRDFDEKCPACSFYYESRNNDDPAVAEIAREYKPSTRFVFNIIDISDANSGIQTYECGPSVHNEVLKYAANEKWGDVLDPEEGRNFTITKTPGTQKEWTSYSVMPGPNPVSVVHHLPEGWKDELDALEGEVPERPSQGELEGLMNQGKQKAFGEVPERTAPDTEEQESVTEETERSAGFSADVSEPPEESSVAQTEEPPSEEVEAPSAAEETPEPTNSNGFLPPRVEGGPQIDPQTEEPVCFGEFDRSEYPCDSCDVVESCQLEKLGLND